MKYHFSKMIGLLFLFSCTDRNTSNDKVTLVKRETDTFGTTKMGTAVSDSKSVKKGTVVKIKEDSTISASDTTWFPFSDSSYRLNVHIFNSNASSEDVINSVISYYHIQEGKSEQIFRDSLYCMDIYLERGDFNNDRMEDILVFCYSGARANPSYHLFLADSIRHTLTYVKGFEDLPNPDFDSVNNIIISLGLAGANYYRFYQINSKNKLINLGHGFEERIEDTTQYERAIRKILKDRQKRGAPGKGK